ncbi:MAG: hypothetical protein A7315_13585 [Candidatus Altiarchaeales archaeon WOR_SM1_79]|nr:MAG: hypothetical protein A7315_13585 [Candidatus Altiarchaeales archaeon WOR_SM1_79]
MSTAKYVIALTQENKKQYMALGVPEDKIKIIPNGVDYERFENVKPESVFDKIGNPDHIVLCVARIVKYKGIQHIIKAIPLIIKSFPDTKFVFIGEDQGYKKELVKIAENIGVLDYCEFINNVNNEDLADYYASADAFVLPSTGEGFGLVALESIVSGTPVILANCGGLKYILKDIGGYPLDITKDVSKQIAEQVEYIFSNQDKVKMEIERQKKIINEKYTWEGVGKMIEEVYYEVLSN